MHFRTIALALLFVACDDDDSARPTPPEDASVATTDSGSPKSIEVVDAGRIDAGRLDAGRPTRTDAGGTPPVDAGGTPPPVMTSDAAAPAEVIPGNTPWCKARYVLATRCTSCHDGNHTAGAPMSLLAYADTQLPALDPSKKVYQAVDTRIHDALHTMPPSGMLSAAELAAIDGWVDIGAPQGDDPTCKGAELPPNVPVTSWPDSECDEVYRLVAHAPGKLDQPWEVPAGQEIHPQVFFDAPWGDEPAQSIGFRSVTDNKKVLHHWILYNGQGVFLTGWAPGGEQSGASFPPGIGMDMPTGTNALRLDMHYFNLQGTQAELDQSGVEICVVRGEHRRKVSAAVSMSFLSFGANGVMVAPGAQNASITGKCDVTASEPVHLMSATPHAHTHAQHMKFKVQKKDGSQIVMLDSPFQFTEQRSYPLLPEVILETGDTVLTSCFYSNDSTRAITFGESTTNEMCFNFAMYYPAGALHCSGLGLLVPGAP